MLRKVGLISALMLALPAFANAWTITAKVGSGAGTIVSDSAAGTVAKTAADRTAIVGYFKVDNADLEQVITIAPADGYTVSSVIVDGQNVTKKDSKGVVLLSYPVAAGAPAKNHTVVVYYTAVTYKVSVTQVPNGVVTVQALSNDATPKVIGAYNVKEIANLKAGSKVRIKAAPNADYKVVTVAGVAAKAGLYAGEADYQDVTVTGNANYTATFAIEPSVVANIYTNSLNGTVGTPITVKATSIANGPVTYKFTSSEPTAITASGATAVYTPKTAGEQTVTVVATTNGKDSEPKTLKFNIQSVAYNQSDVCSACHSGRDQYIAAGYNASSHKSTTKHVITCTDCHAPTADSHATRSTYVVYSGNSIKRAAGCQACHTPGMKWGIYSSNLVLKAPHAGGAVTNGTATGGTSKTQYVTQGFECADCHGHNNTINAEFAEGGHGAVSSDDLNAFTHYDWNTRTNNGKQDNGNCGRCHTTIGFLKFANLSAQYNDRLKLVSGQPNATLACITCHKTAEGELRTDITIRDGGLKLADGYKAKFTATGATTSYVQFDSYKNSNICIPCHSGRTTEAIVKSYYAQNNYSTGTTGFYQHAANIGQTFAGTGAYQFDATNYANLPKHHTGVGMSVNSDKGPCATCHNPHSLEVKDFSNCMTQYCHPSTFGQEDVERAQTNYNAAVKVLTALMEQKIHPLFADTSKPLGEERTKVFFGRFGKLAGEPADMTVTSKAAGAWYNWHILTNADPTAWVHNPAYARAILLDTIDFLDDGVNNGSAKGTIATSTATTSVEKLAAKGLVATQGCNGCHYEALATKHFANVTSAIAASFITSRTECLDCHNKTTYHYATPAVNAEWAESGHGAPTGLPFVGRQWATQAECNVCHTSTGFRKFVASNFTNSAAWAEKTEGANETLTCKACHTNSSDFKGSVLAVSQYNAPMEGNFASTIKISFPDVGESNVCIPCHASRENGESLAKVADTKFTNPHYLAAAAVFYGKGGFQFYTSGVRYNTYGAAGKVGKNANWSHGRLGMDNYSASGSNDLLGVSNNTGNKGQCVACHLGPKNTHTFGAIEVANATLEGAKNLKSGKAITRTCFGCHQDNADAVAPTIASFIDEEKEIWYRMFDFYKWQLSQYGINYTDNYPYFSGSFAATVGTTFGGAGVSDANKTEGAAMNLKLLIAEKGSHVHNRAFGRALVADSITYLQKGSVGDRTEFSLDPNNIIKFSDYSAARPANYPGQVGPNVSISTLKGYLTKAASNPVKGEPDGFVRR
ncbi:hypothetical protein LPW11_02435 [Geomonas sp. RF6]|uniref:hypothetical protein n=1 Tax=Geomonas sp. RF6 TaxID=2897342 RepID=UPI001E2B293D|nr:hypothetical protein [Geomonas sp. RF6]UFS71056.1 hypothetical protein LPW11_02435 [Geomonas sp. RF6]